MVHVDPTKFIAVRRLQYTYIYIQIFGILVTGCYYSLSMFIWASVFSDRSWFLSLKIYSEALVTP